MSIISGICRKSMKLVHQCNLNGDELAQTLECGSQHVSFSLGHAAAGIRQESNRPGGLKQAMAMAYEPRRPQTIVARAAGGRHRGIGSWVLFTDHGDLLLNQIRWYLMITEASHMFPSCLDILSWFSSYEMIFLLHRSKLYSIIPGILGVISTYDGP